MGEAKSAFCKTTLSAGPFNIFDSFASSLHTFAAISCSSALFLKSFCIDDTISKVVSSILYATHCHRVTSLSGELKSILCVLLLAGSVVMAVPFLEATNLVIF